VQISLQYLYTVYDEVNIVDLADSTVSTLYRGNTSFPAAASGAKMVDATRDFVSGYVHPEDRDRCMRYLDVTTIDKRLEVSGKSYLADAFRTLRPNGTYGLIASVLVPVLIDGGPALLVCVRQTHDDLVETLRQETKISKSLLWDTLIDLVPAGIFWKDADRRFLGVNKNFLDFYSFSSTNDVLGKTDEDMGWHPDEDPFRNDEVHVLMGETINEVRGVCLCRDELRDIVATKRPLYSNGEIVGLVGYFEDLGPHRT
jgi:PAS domain-containing protein